MDFIEAAKKKKECLDRDVRRHNLDWQIGADLFKYYDDWRDSTDTLTFLVTTGAYPI